MLKYGTLTVSSVLHYQDYAESYMFDNDPETFWHSGERNGGSWVRYVFNTEQVVSMVSIIRRQRQGVDRYKNVCFILKNARAEEIEKKCTTESYGKPFLHDTTIKVPFTSNLIVSEIQIIFNENYGQIAELIIN